MVFLNRSVIYNKLSFFVPYVWVCESQFIQEFRDGNRENQRGSYSDSGIEHRTSKYAA